MVLGDEEAALLESLARPIVLAPRRPDAAVAASVAPGAPELGVLLPYAPLHHLLLERLGVLVLTSGNTSDEPIAYDDADALERLGGIADLLLVHDRPIETRTDDSVLRVCAVAGRRRTLMLRRSRGYVPASLPLPLPAARPILACGAELKSTFCLARGRRAVVSQHIGDLERFETLRSFTTGIEHLQRLLAIRPEVVVHDLHPEYLSTKHAFERDGVELVGVQHHHAHLAACLAEHGDPGRAVGAIFDGTGLGTDGTIWGGELLVGDLGSFRRAGMLLPVRLPGGARAIRQPWRMACAWLDACGIGDRPPALSGHVDEERWRQVRRLAGSELAPVTTSMGRLFDAVAALCGLRAEVTYEGQAAIELEAACEPHERRRHPIDVVERDGVLVIDPRETVQAVAAELAAGVPVGVVASRFHGAVIHAAVEACTALAAAERTDRVVLSGGVFQNRRLLEGVAAGLGDGGLQVLVPERLPVNDGGISYGQAAVAVRLLEEA